MGCGLLIYWLRFGFGFGFETTEALSICVDFEDFDVTIDYKNFFVQKKKD